MKNQSRHAQTATPEKRSILALLTIAVLLIMVLLLASCRKTTDIPFTGDKSVTDAIDSATASTVKGEARFAVNTYYVSPTGNDNNAGTIDQPWFTLQKAWTMIAAGDLVYMRGGNYVYSAQQGLTGKNGTASDIISIWAYPGEKPVITRGSSFTKPYWHRSGVFFTGDYFHWKGIELKGFQNIDGNIEDAFLAYNPNNNTFEQLNIHDNHAGFYLEGNCNGNTFLNSDFHDNYDAQGAGGNSDGLATAYMPGLTSTTTIRGCRAWNNGDDGFDNFENSGYVLIDNCWTWHNGYIKGTNTAAGDGVGFKLGSDFMTTPSGVNVVKRRLQRSLAFDNRNAGAHINEADFTTEIYNNTFFRNQITGLNFHYNNRVHYFRNNVSLGNGVIDAEISTNSIRSNNSEATANDVSWTVNASTADFVSTDTSGVRGARQADGSLPNINFLKLAASSDLIDGGMNVGIAYSGANPDRGAYEYGGVVTTPSNQSPVANAGADQTIKLPLSNITLNGSGTDPDGTIASYAWTLRSGPNTPTLTGAGTTALSASNLVAGAYVFRLTVTDNGGLTAFDEVSVFVAATTAPVNQAPVANAGVDKAITLPVSSVSLTGTGTDADGSIASYAWTFRSGPSTPVLAGANTATLTASSLVAGTYVVRLTVTDNLGLTAFDDASIVVSGVTTTTNLPPVANAGSDLTITLPVNTVTILGSGTDPDGTIAGYTWTYRSGPSTPVLSGATTATLKASSLKAGTYVFRLTVKDNKGKTAFDQVSVVVKPAVVTSTNLINTSAAVLDAGNSYYVVQNFGTLPDDNQNPTRSTLRIFENGVELNPAHSTHYDIETLGKGRFSHWGDGAFIVVYFSASDNTNPKTNGRTYTYSIK